MEADSKDQRPLGTVVSQVVHRQRDLRSVQAADGGRTLRRVVVHAGGERQGSDLISQGGGLFRDVPVGAAAGTVLGGVEGDGSGAVGAQQTYADQPVRLDDRQNGQDRHGVDAAAEQHLIFVRGIAHRTGRGEHVPTAIRGLVAEIIDNVHAVGGDGDVLLGSLQAIDGQLLHIGHRFAAVQGGGQGQQVLQRRLVQGEGGVVKPGPGAGFVLFKTEGHIAVAQGQGGDAFYGRGGLGGGVHHLFTFCIAAGGQQQRQPQQKRRQAQNSLHHGFGFLLYFRLLSVTFAVYIRVRYMLRSLSV